MALDRETTDRFPSNNSGIPTAADNGVAPTDTKHSTLTTPSSVGFSRRRALAGVAGVGALGALAACGSSSDGSTTTGGGDPTAPADGGARAAGAIATTDQVPANGGLIITDPEPLVITQPASGDFKCFTAICTHQGCTVGSVEDNVIICPCHKSHYDATTGAVISGPAPAPLAAKSITVTGDQITLV